MYIFMVFNVSNCDLTISSSLFCHMHTFLFVECLYLLSSSSSSSLPVFHFNLNNGSYPTLPISVCLSPSIGVVWKLSSANLGYNEQLFENYKRTFFYEQIFSPHMGIFEFFSFEFWNVNFFNFLRASFLAEFLPTNLSPNH